MFSPYFFPINQFRRTKIRFVSAGVATEYVDDVGVKTGRLHKVFRLGVENLTSAFTRFRFGAWNGSVFHILGEQKSPAAATVYSIVDPFLLLEDERLRVEIVGASASDIINVYVDEFFKEV